MSAYVPAASTYVHQEYPKWKYHADGSSRIVNDADEEAELGTGWRDSKHLADVPKPAAESIENELDALLEQASALGITIDKRWGVKRLREAIAQANA